MHELSIAQHIAEIVTEEADQQHAINVMAVCLEIGTIAGIETEALNFAWQSAILNTILAHAELKIDMVEAKACCEDCGHKFTLKDLYDLCPVCRSFQKEILEGKDLKIKAIEIEY